MEASKITKGLEYKLIISSGKKVNGNNFNLQYLDTEKNLIRVGIIASKKLGNAVKRNYVKRRIKALFNKVLLKNDIYKKDYVIVGKKGILFEKFDSLYEELNLILKKIDR